MLFSFYFLLFLVSFSIVLRVTCVSHPFSSRSWTVSHSPSASQRLCFHLALTHDSHIASHLHDRLLSVSDPDSSAYGLHYSLDDLKSLTHSAAFEHRKSKVLQWIQQTLPDTRIVHSQGRDIESIASIDSPIDENQQQIPSARVSLSGDFVHLCATRIEAEKLFQTELKAYIPTKLHARAVAAGEWHAAMSDEEKSQRFAHVSVVRAVSNVQIPSELHDSIDFIGGLNTPIHSHRLSRALRYDQVKQQRLSSEANPHDLHCNPKLSKGCDERTGVQRSHAKASSASDADSSNLPDQQCNVPKPVQNGLVQLKPPRILNFTGGDRELSIVWQIYCYDGRMNRDPKSVAPCSTIDSAALQLIHNSPITSFTVILTDRMNYHTLLPLLGVDICSSNGICTSTVPIRNYDGHQITIRAHYSDGITIESCRSTWVFAHDFATPDFLRELYNIPEGMRARHPNNSQAVIEFEEQYFDPIDLTTFLDSMGQLRTEVDAIVGANDPSAGRLVGGESTLDIQVMLGLAQGARTYFWSVAGKEKGNTEEPFLRWIEQTNDIPNPPLVHSVSYGDVESELPLWYTSRINFEFMKMGLRGQTVLVAAGDEGVASDWSGSGRTVEDICQVTHPEFPTSSTYVVSVGATMMSNRPTGMCWNNWRGVHVGCSKPREIVCTSQLGGVITTGGGSSNRFPMPEWQRSHADYYLHKSGAQFPADHKWNRTGRFYPDITCLGTKFPIIMNGETVPTAGTSASTPVIASMITLWNDIRLHQGMAPLGFVTPLLYKMHKKHPECFQDIVYGNNSCLLRDQDCCKEGFQAAAGFDMVSGLGSPNWEQIARVLKDQYHTAKKHSKQQSQQMAQAPAPMVAVDQSFVDPSSPFHSSLPQLNWPLFVSIAVAIFSMLFSVHMFIQMRSIKAELARRTSMEDGSESFTRAHELTPLIRRL